MSPSPVFELAERYVERFAALDPVSATGEGIGGHDHEMTDWSPAGSDERAELGRATVRALQQAEGRNDADRAAAAVLRERLAPALEGHDAGERVRGLLVLGSPGQYARMGVDLMPRATVDDWQVLAERMALVPQTLSSIEVGFTEGVALGIVAARRQAVACAQQADLWGGVTPSPDGAPPFFHALVDEYDASGLDATHLGGRLRELARRGTDASP